MLLILLPPYHSHVHNTPSATILTVPFLGSGVRVGGGLCSWKYTPPLASFGSPVASPPPAPQLRISGIEA